MAALIKRSVDASPRPSMRAAPGVGGAGSGFRQARGGAWATPTTAAATWAPSTSIARGLRGAHQRRTPRRRPRRRRPQPEGDEPTLVTGAARAPGLRGDLVGSRGSGGPVCPLGAVFTPPPCRGRPIFSPVSAPNRGACRSGQWRPRPPQSTKATLRSSASRSSSQRRIRRGASVTRTMATMNPTNSTTMARNSARLNISGMPFS